MHLIDPELLRTFVAFADAGSLARAAIVVGRSPSAVTAQMQRLEETVGEALLFPVGRSRELTPAGQEFLAHARRILEVNRQAWLSIKGARADGRAVIGATQDFSETVLPGLLRMFALTHPRVRLELRIGRSYELAKALEEGSADVIVAMSQEVQANEVGIIREPMVWLGSAEGLAVSSEPELPLAILDPPCGFRAAAISALDTAGIPYRIAASSASLSGLRAAVSAGIAITLRTARWIDSQVKEIPSEMRLPDVPEAMFSVRIRQDSNTIATALADLLCNSLMAIPPSTAR